MSNVIGSTPDEPSSSTGPSRKVGSTRSAWRTKLREEDLDGDWRYVRRVLIAITLLALTYFLWTTARVWLLVFAAILLAVLLDAVSDLIARYSPLTRRWSLPVGILLLATLIIGFFLVFGAQIQGQLQSLFQRLPEATDTIGARFGVANAAGQIEEAIGDGARGNVLSRVAGFGFTLIGVLADLVLVLVAAIYLAANPGVYRRGAVKLFPKSQHERLEDALDSTATGLRLWAGGQLVTMALVGTMAALSYWFIGLPSPVALGILAGLTNFIPFLGPILGAVPPIIFALTMDANTVIWTLLAVLAIQQLEGNVITPLIQRNAVLLPPALGLFAILVFGLLFGFLGIFLAVPLTVAIMVMVKKLWIRETLGEETSLPGEDDSEEARSGAGQPAAHAR